jgi:hypothetical protein
MILATATIGALMTARMSRFLSVSVDIRVLRLLGMDGNRGSQIWVGVSMVVKKMI